MIPIAFQSRKRCDIEDIIDIDDRKLFDAIFNDFIVYCLRLHPEEDRMQNLLDYLWDITSKSYGTFLFCFEILNSKKNILREILTKSEIKLQSVFLNYGIEYQCTPFNHLRPKIDNKEFSAEKTAQAGLLLNMCYINDQRCFWGREIRNMMTECIIQWYNVVRLFGLQASQPERNVGLFLPSSSEAIKMMLRNQKLCNAAMAVVADAISFNTRWWKQILHFIFKRESMKPNAVLKAPIELYDLWQLRIFLNVYSEAPDKVIKPYHDGIRNFFTSNNITKLTPQTTQNMIKACNETSIINLLRVLLPQIEASKDITEVLEKLKMSNPGVMDPFLSLYMEVIRKRFVEEDTDVLFDLLSCDANNTYSFILCPSSTYHSKIHFIKCLVRLNGLSVINNVRQKLPWVLPKTKECTIDDSFDFFKIIDQDYLSTRLVIYCNFSVVYFLSFFFS